MIFLFEEKVIFRSQDSSIFLYLVNFRTLKSVMSSHTLLHIRIYNFDCFVTTSVSLLSFVTKWYMIQKICQKIFFALCVTVATFAVERIVWN